MTTLGKHRQLRTPVAAAIMLLIGVCYWWLAASFATANQQLMASHEQYLQDDAYYSKLIAELTAKRLKREAAERKQTAEQLTAALVRQIKAGAATVTLPSAILGLPCNHAREHNDPARIDVLVNKQHCLKPLTYAPSDLASDTEVTLRREAFAAYNAMKQAAAQAGAGFTATSSYRSHEAQIATFADWYRSLGSAEKASDVAALPGYSEHQLGLAVDLRVGGCALECFRSTAAYRWLQAHAHEYGFIERYPLGKTTITGYGAEAWHWRYVGKATASDMHGKKIDTLETYYDMPGGKP